MRNGEKINNVDHTSGHPSACVFAAPDSREKVFVFWTRNDPPYEPIYVSGSGNGINWPPGRALQGGDESSVAWDGPAACVFKNQLFVFWTVLALSKGGSSLDGFRVQTSTDGVTWSKAQRIDDYSRAAPAVCVFDLGIDRLLFMFWQASDFSNSIYFKASKDGEHWPLGRKINNVDSTAAFPAACVFQKRLFLFWKANDPSNSIYFSASKDGATWPSGRKINNVDSTSAPPNACVFQNRLFLFWKANDPSNSIYVSVSTDGLTWPPGQKINNIDSAGASLGSCVLQSNLGVKGQHLFLFWRSNDPSHSIYFTQQQSL